MTFLKRINLTFLKEKYFQLSLIIIFLIFLFFYSWIILNVFDKNVLYGDEVFYWEQAKKIREEFKFINFQNTQPLLYPIVLSLSFPSVVASRLISVFLFLIANLLFFYLNKKYIFIKTTNPKLYEFFSILLFFIFPLTVFFATSMHTESLFFVFLFLTLIVFFKILSFQDLKQTKVKNIIYYLLFGFFLGLTMQARIVGVPLSLFLILYLLFLKKINKFFVFSFILSYSIFIPYLLLGGFEFLSAKSSPVLILENTILQLLHHLFNIFYFWWPFIILIFIGIIEALKKRDILLRFWVWFFLFFLFFSVLTELFFLRYGMLSVPSIIVCLFIGYDKLRQKINKKLLFLIFLILISLQITTIFKFKNFALAKFYYSNWYFIKPPEDCLEIKDLLVSDRTSDKFDIAQIKLPYFEQPPYKVYEYFFIFSPDKEYNYLILNYIDDIYALAINGEKIIKEKSEPFKAQIIRHNFLPGEEYGVNILVGNQINIGGIGQILICSKNPYQK